MRLLEVSDIAQHIAVSHKVETEDLDWENARKIGLTRQEIESLAYFADIESQTVYYFLEVAKLSRGAADFQFARLRHDGDARGIVAAVLEFAQALDDDGHNCFGPDIADYSTHARRLLREFLAT